MQETNVGKSGISVERYTYRGMLVEASAAVVVVVVASMCIVDMGDQREYRRALERCACYSGVLG